MTVFTASQSFCFSMSRIRDYANRSTHLWFAFSLQIYTRHCKGASLLLIRPATILRQSYVAAEVLKIALILFCALSDSRKPDNTNRIVYAVSQISTARHTFCRSYNKNGENRLTSLVLHNFVNMCRNMTVSREYFSAVHENSLFFFRSFTIFFINCYILLLAYSRTSFQIFYGQTLIAV